MSRSALEAVLNDFLGYEVPEERVAEFLSLCSSHGLTVGGIESCVPTPVENPGILYKSAKAFFHGGFVSRVMFGTPDVLDAIMRKYILLDSELPDKRLYFMMGTNPHRDIPGYYIYKGTRPTEPLISTNSIVTLIEVNHWSYVGRSNPWELIEPLKEYYSCGDEDSYLFRFDEEGHLTYVAMNDAERKVVTII